MSWLWKRTLVAGLFGLLWLLAFGWPKASADDETFELPGEKTPVKAVVKKAVKKAVMPEYKLPPIYGPPKEWQSFRSTSRLTCAVRTQNQLWAGTQGAGIIRWSLSTGGYHFLIPKVTDYAARTINAIAATEEGDIWVATEYGAALVKASSGEWTFYRKKDGLTDNSIEAIAVMPDGTVWAAGEKGVARFAQGKWKAYTTRNGLPFGKIKAIGRDTEGRIWLSPAISTPFYFQNNRFTKLKNFPEVGSTCIVSDGKGGLWFCNDQGAVFYNGEKARLYTTEHGLAGPKVQAIYADAGGGVWLGTKDSGLSYFREGRWTTISRSRGLPATDIRALLGAPGGRVLLVSFLDGVHRYEDRRWFSLPTGIAGNKINAISHAPDGSVWVGTDSGASRFHKGYWFNYTSQLPNPDIRSFTFDPTGVLWIGTYGGGVVRFDGKQWKTIEMLGGLADNHIVGSALSPEGLWFVHPQKGISLLVGEEWKTFTSDSTAGALPSAYELQGIHMDQRRQLWIGSNGAGITIRPLDGAWKTLSQMKGAAGKGAVYGISTDAKGFAWVAAKDGLYKIQGETVKQRFTKRDGLPEERVLSVATEGEKVWIGTQKGVACYDGTSWRAFNTEMGLVSNHITVISISPYGEKWFGSAQDGLTIYRGE